MGGGRVRMLRMIKLDALGEKNTIFATMNLMRVTRSDASAVESCLMQSFWSTPEARVLHTLA